VDGAGTITLGGSFLDTVDFGDGVASSAGGSDIFLASYAANGTHRWSLTFGDTEDDRLTDLAVNADRRVLASGTVRGTVDFGAGAQSLPGEGAGFVAAFSPAGQVEWVRILPNMTPTAIAVTPSGGALVGGFDRSGFEPLLERLDALGEPVWRLDKGLEPAEIDAVAVHGDDRIVLAGSGLVVAMTGAGASQWQSTLSTCQGDRCLPAERLAIDDEGHIFVGGSIAVDFDVGYVVHFTGDGDYQWTAPFIDIWRADVIALAARPAGSVLAGIDYGCGTDFGGGHRSGRAGALVSFAHDGTHDWDVLFPGSLLDFAASSDSLLIVGDADRGPIGLGEAQVEGPFAALFSER
jgi:hypothetical protein